MYSVTLDLWINGIRNLTSPWPNYIQEIFVCKVWSKSVHWFRGYRIHQIFLPLVKWLTLNFWTNDLLNDMTAICTCQCLIVTRPSFIKICLSPFIQVNGKSQGMTHGRTDARANRKHHASGTCRWRTHGRKYAIKAGAQDQGVRIRIRQVMLSNRFS